ncbi:MAG: Gfo/Idh/MocA family oxidoreductase [Gemmatimonadota bacterium]|nr:Gfo/Idh/MocA family oxidoreductase [Gemmatimonadota bacterium]
MINIGIVGAENSHTVAISKTLNIDKKVPGCRVTHVWGEAARYARDAQDRGQIPNIVEQPEEMIGQVDAACVDHRDAKYHLPAVWPLIEAGIPVFVDKPFCYRVEEGRRFLDRALELGVPVCSFSVLPRQASFTRLKNDIADLGRVVSVVTTGPCDIESEWGGVFFYGIHQVDMAVRLLDNDVTHAQVNLGEHNHTGTLYSSSGSVSTLNLFTDGHSAFHVSVICEKGRVDRTIGYDENPYLGGARAFCDMFKTGNTDETRESMLMPVAVLEALEKSIREKKKVEVPSIG